MKYSILMVAGLGLALMVAGLGLTLSGCGEEAAPQVVAPVVVEAPAAPAAPAVEAAPPAAPAAGVCGRAVECCRAYVAAMGPAGAAAAASCDAMQQTATMGAAAEPGCSAAIDGWRQGLTAMNIAVPASCAAQ